MKASETYCLQIQGRRRWKEYIFLQKVGTNLQVHTVSEPKMSIDNTQYVKVQNYKLHMVQQSPLSRCYLLRTTQENCRALAKNR
jgi:hypothetical protein